MEKIKNKEYRIIKIAVLMTAYNGELWIKKQIKSILNQKKVKVDIFISIDLSNDNTLKICEKIKNFHSNIHILDYGKKYGSSAKNFINLFTLVNFRKYDFISLSDQDDIWLEDKLIRAVNCIEYKKYSAYSSNVTPFSNKKIYPILFKSDPQKKFDYLFEGGGPGCTYVFNNELAQNIQYLIRNNSKIYDEINHYDWFFYAFARANNFKWFIDKYASVLYRQHSKNELGVNRGIKSFYKRFNVVMSGTAMEQAKKTAIFININNDKLIKKMLFSKKISYLYMIINFTQCRRRLLDQIYFLIASFLLFIFR